MNKVNYEDALEILKELRYEKPTSLQAKAWQDIGYKVGAREFIISSTSSGKTLVPIVNFLLDYNGSKMIYIVPFRALATQKIEEFKKICQQFELDIQVSTSEYCAADSDIKSGNCDVAIIIYEKVYAFLAEDENFFKHYNYVVMDEIGIVEDIERGLKSDYVLHRACAIKKTNVYILATPFYNWNLYIENYKFHTIRENEDDRPIKIYKKEILYDPKVQNDPNSPYRKMLSDICREELQQGRKILIFSNRRIGVEAIGRNLFNDLKSILSARMTADEIKQRALEKMQMDELDLQGIYSNHDYQAYSYGITYHHSALPEETRNLIESDFLADDGILKIVVSTSTLAYGINSNIDTVIVTDLQTFDNNANEKGDKVTSRFLQPNEYMNYIGRAGRLGRRDCGYAYTFIKKSTDKKIDETGLWEKLKKEVCNPPVISSQYNVLQKEKLTSKIGLNIPLCVLNCFPRKLGKGISFEKIVARMSNFSNASKTEYWRMNLVKVLEDLEKRELIIKSYDDYEELDLYQITQLGLSIGGGIFSLAVFDELYQLAQSLNTVDKPFDLVYRLCQIGDIKLIGGKQKGKEKFLKEAQNWLNYYFYKGYISNKLRQKINNALEDINQKFRKTHNIEKVPEKDMQFFVAFMKAVALFSWSTSTPIQKIKDNTFMPYGDVKRLGEKGKYYVDALHNIMEIYPQKDKICKYLVKLGASLYYGVHVDLLQNEDILKLEPAQARKLRNQGIRNYVREVSGIQ